MITVINNINAQRLSKLSKALKSYDRAQDTYDPGAVQQALLAYKELTHQIEAAYGPTFKYMKGMDTFSNKYT